MAMQDKVIQRYNEVSRSKTARGKKKAPPKAPKKVAKTKSASPAKRQAQEKVDPEKPDQKKSAKKSSEKRREDKKQVERAIELVASVEEAKREELELQQSIEKEIEKDEARSSRLVRRDASPVNMNRESLILEYAPLIKYIAQRIAARLPANIELDDLISSGVIGLMDAIDKYDSSRDNKFKTYAEFRIRGAILDELRAQDWVPRSVREKAKQLERCYSKIEQEKGRQATDEEVCEALGLNRDEYHDLLNQVRSVSLLSFDDISNFSKADKKSLYNLSEAGGKVPTPFNEVNLASVKRMVAEAIQDLPEKQRLVLSLYYYEDLNLKEIGRVLDVTESRVSQLHTQAILRLKGRLRNNWDEFVALMG